MLLDALGEDMITQALLDAIGQAVESVLNEARSAAGLILNEADLKCQLFSRLAAIPQLRHAMPSSDPGVQAVAVHSEISWFDENGILAFKPDLTVTDPAYLSIHRSLQPGRTPPSKGVHFVGSSVLLELKFYRGRAGIPRSAVARIRRDMEKLQGLIRTNAARAPQFQFEGFVVIVSRYAGRPRELDLLIQGHNDPRVRLVVECCDVQRQ